MQDRGLVSVIMPSFNCGQFIEESISSIRMQTYQNWELLIVDDCSTDDTVTRVLAIKEIEKRIRVIQNKHHCGAAEARNIALRNARGRWIAFLDSDDIWEPTKLDRQIRFMISNDYHFSCHNYVEINEASQEIGRIVSCKKHFGKVDLYFCCWPGCLTVMYDASIIGLIQIHNIKMNNDTAMWLKVADRSDCHLLNETLARYRKRNNSISRHSKLRRVLGHYSLFRVAQELNPIAASFWVVMNVFGNAYKKLKYVKKYTVE